MKTFTSEFRVLLVFITFAMNISQGYSQQVINYPDGDRNLDERWEWAIDIANRQKFSGTFWVGYSIERLMGMNSYIGCHRSEDEGARTLRQIIEGIPGSAVDDDDYHVRKTIRHSPKEESCEKVMKEVAILFKCSLKKNDDIQIRDVSITNLCLHFDLDDLPLIWLGKSRHLQSINHLKNLYNKLYDIDPKEEIITAAGIHQNSQPAVDFLKNVLLSKEDDDLRETAAFWLGQQDTEEALDILHKVAQTDRSTDVREKAVFGIYSMKIKPASNVLIDLARKAENRDVRRKAIFWLGQKASHNVSEILENIVFSDEETEIQQQAVFALSQLPEDRGIPRLIKVAKTHPNYKIRKKAIFWLGQSDDERALDVLIELVKGK